jgi:hypothetical protein
MVMDFSGHIATRLATLGRMLAVVAALALAAGLHPPHAQAAGDPADHSHFSASCIKADVEEPATAKTGAAPSGHTDCTQLFDPLVRPAPECTVAFAEIAVPTPPARPFRHLVFPFDPPPPRARA